MLKYINSSAQSFGDRICLATDVNVATSFKVQSEPTLNDVGIDGHSLFV